MQYIRRLCQVDGPGIIRYKVSVILQMCSNAKRLIQINEKDKQVDFDIPYFSLHQQSKQRLQTAALNKTCLAFQSWRREREINDSNVLEDFLTGVQRREEPSSPYPGPATHTHI